MIYTDEEKRFLGFPEEKIAGLSDMQVDNVLQSLINFLMEKHYKFNQETEELVIEK